MRKLLAFLALFPVIAFGQSAQVNLSKLSHSLLSGGIVPASNGGSGASTITGVLKGNGTSPFTTASVADITALFTGCSGTEYLGADGACHAVGAGTPGGLSGQIQYNNAGAFGGIATTGSGNVVEATSPTLITPNLGTPSALTLTNATGLPIAGLTGLGSGVGTWLATPTLGNLNLSLGVTLPSISGVITTGHCASFASSTTIQDSGAGCGGTGTVTSVALTVPSWLTVGGSPITTSGTLAVTATGSQTANEFIATPNGAAGAVGLRAIVAADIPTLNQSTTGNAATATALAATPTTCLSTQAATGILANGNATGCWTPTGSGTVTDGSGTTTANELLASTTTAHSYSVVATLPTAAMPALTGDVTNAAGSLATTVGKINNAAIPASANCLSTNSSSQFTSGCPESVNAQTGTTYTVATSDCGKQITVNNAAAIAVTVPQATGSFATCQFDVTDIGAGTATLTPTTSTINGSASLAIAQNRQCSVNSDGTNWQVIGCTALVSGGSGSPGGAANSVQYNNAGAFGGVLLGAGQVLQGNAGAPTATSTPTLGVVGTTTGSVTLASSHAGGSAVLSACSTCSSALTFGFPNGTGGTLALADVTQTFSAPQTFANGIIVSEAGAASTAPVSLTGSIFTGGTGTTTLPYFYANQGATAPTTFSTSGTYWGANAASGFAGRWFDVYINGTEAWKVSTYGNLISLPNAATAAISVTPNCEYAFVKVTASATGTFTVNAPATCTPVDGQRLELKVISPAGGTITYAWNAAYVASATLALPTTSNAASKEDYFSFQYDADKSAWAFLASNQGF